MTETPQQYTARLIGLAGDRDPWQVLAATPARLRALVADSTSQALASKPSPERWSVVQILAHLADTETVAAWRLRAVLGQDGVTLQAFDQNVWAEAFAYEHTNPVDSVAVFETLRLANLRLLRTVDPTRHQHAGQHQERGTESIEHMMRMMSGHDLNHLGQIERLLSESRTLSAGAS
jgi:uncharacterized damage-inducible protein DinB